MNSLNTTRAEQFAWLLTQERINLLGPLLYKLLTLLNVAESGGRAAHETACLLHEMREQCCERAGAADPLDGLPLIPRFEDEEAAATEESFS